MVSKISRYLVMPETGPLGACPHRAIKHIIEVLTCWHYAQHVLYTIMPEKSSNGHERVKSTRLFYGMHVLTMEPANLSHTLKPDSINKSLFIGLQRGRLNNHCNNNCLLGMKQQRIATGFFSHLVIQSANFNVCWNHVEL